MIRPGRGTALAVLAAALCLAALPSPSPAAAPDDLDRTSLPLRTALHKDPTLDAPFERLVDLYRKARRLDHLLAMYRTHVGRYPQDAAAAAVLVRLLEATGQPEALATARSAVAQHPDHAYLRFLLYRTLREAGKPGALDELDRAVERETLPARRSRWIDVLVREALAAGRRDLAEKHLAHLAEEAGTDPPAALAVARRMIEAEFYEPALDVLARAAEGSPDPDTLVEIEMAAATCEVGLGRGRDAADRLSRLLDKLTADYWRRPEIMRRRIALVESEAERDAMVRRARERVRRHPKDEAAALDLARTLAGFQRRTEALEALLEAGRRIPDSIEIEKEILGLFDLLYDEKGREAYLAQRIQAMPGRTDLRGRHVLSLFLLGRREEARRALETMLEPLDADARVARLLETGRDLRRANLPADAADVLARVVALAPGRLGVRRELAELYLALGRRPEARRLFAEEVPDDVPAEDLLEAVTFMVGHEMFAEARTLLKGLMERGPTRLEPRLLLVDVEGRLMRRRAGETVLAEARKLADTAARYRAWLEAGVAFHERFETVGRFLEAERARLDLDRREWSDRWVERRLALASVSAAHDRAEAAAAMIRDDLAEDPPETVRRRLRQRLVRLLAKVETAPDLLEQELESLARDDPSAADACHARLALLYAEQGRADLARQRLEKVNVQGLFDPNLLRGLHRLHRAMHTGDHLAVLERLTVVDATDREAWRQWLTALVRAGRDTRLRQAIRTLLAGVDRMPIGEEPLRLLREHLLASYWRSIGRRLASGAEASLADALALLEEAARAARTRDQGLWIAWTRAHVLNRLGREGPRDEAIAELERRVADVADAAEAAKTDGADLPPDAAGEADAAEAETAKADPSADEGAPDEGDTDEGEAGEGAAEDGADEGDAEPAEAPPTRIVFPGGMSVSLAQARRLLRADSSARPEAEIRPPREPAGPMAPLRVRWAFDVPRRDLLTGVQPAGEGRVLVTAQAGDLFCLDAETGKLLWHAGAPPSAVNLPVPEPTLVREGRIYLGRGGEVLCLGTEEGRLLWRSRTAPGGRAASGRPRATLLAVRAGEVLACDPSAATVACLDRETGKVRWTRDLAEGRPPAQHAVGGLALEGDRLFLYGRRNVILDAGTGEVVWSLDAEGAGTFPLSLAASEEAGRLASSGAVGAGGSGPYSPVSAARRAAFSCNPPSGGRACGRSVTISPPYSFSSISRSRSRWSWSGAGSPRRPGGGTAYVNYLQVGAPSSSPGPGGGGRVAAVAPAVAWAKRSDAHKFGALAAGRLLLFASDGTVQIHPVGLPMIPDTCQGTQGVYLGRAGRMACLLGAGGTLFALDPVTGRSRQVTLDVVGSGAGAGQAWVHAAVDGPLVYAWGPAGVRCVNPVTGERLLTVGWPASAEPAGGVKPASGGSLSYLFAGIRVQDASGAGRVIGPVGCVRKGLLVASVCRWRLVALEHVDRPEEQEKETDKESWQLTKTYSTPSF